MKKYTNKQAFSLVLAMGLTLLLSFTGLYVIEYMVPFSQNIKGVENASQSFYEAYGGIEDSLLYQSKNPVGYQTGSVFSGSVQEYQYKIIGNGRFSPRQGVEEGSSEYNKDYNKLGLSEPAQFLIGNGKLTGAGVSLRLFLQVPDVFPASGNQLNTSTDDAVILWQLSSTGASLSATGTYLISESDVNTAGYFLEFMNSNLKGELSDGTASNFLAFYNGNCLVGKECVLKLSIINPLISTLVGAPKIPYLEYKLRAVPDIPLRESVIEVDGKSYGFSKQLKVSVPQLTTNSAFDFTVFQ